MSRAILSSAATTALLFGAWISAAAPALAAETGAAGPTGATGTAEEAVTGDAVYKHCVACHGPRGVGGEGGKYPRIAGLPVDYVARQLHDFRQRSRINKPMIPIFRHQRFNDQVIDIVAAHIAAMPVPALGLWPYQPAPETLTTFPSMAAFADTGATRYAKTCAGCHGADGAGGDGPPLIDQYPAYLMKQVQDFATNQRRHASSAQCAALPPAETEAVVGHLVTLGKR